MREFQIILMVVLLLEYNVCTIMTVGNLPEHPLRTAFWALAGSIVMALFVDVVRMI